MENNYFKLRSVLLLLLFFCFSIVNAQTVPLGDAAQFAILAGQTINANTKVNALNYAGAGSSISANISAIAGVLPDGENSVPSALENLESAMSYCWEQEGISILNSNINENTYEAGVYILNESGVIGSGELILNGDSSSVFIFNIQGDLIIEEGAQIVLGDVKPENIYWNVSGKVIIRKNTQFTGIVLAQSDIDFYVPSGLTLSLLSLGSTRIIAVDTATAAHETSFFSYNKMANTAGFCSAPFSPFNGYLYNAVEGRFPYHEIRITNFGTNNLGVPYNKATWELELTSSNNTVYTISADINTLGNLVNPDFTNLFHTKYGFSLPCGSYTLSSRIYNACTKSSTPLVSTGNKLHVNCFTISLANTSTCQNTQTTLTATVINDPDLNGNFLLSFTNPSPIRWYWNNTIISNANSTTITIPTGYTSQPGQNTIKVEMDLTYDNYTITERQSATVTVAGSAGINAQVLGDPNHITTIDASQFGGNVNFSGEYHIVGHLEFINGTFTLEPGTKFYLDPFTFNGIIGSTFLDNTTLKISNATLSIKGATLTTNDCLNHQKWGGVIITDNSTIYSEAAGFPSKNSEISYSKYGIQSQQMTTSNNPTPAANVYYPNTNFYSITNTDFLNNTNSFTDIHKSAAAITGEGITSCNFNDSNYGISFTYDSNTNSGPYGGDYTKAKFEGNTFINISSCGIWGTANYLTLKSNKFINNATGIAVSPYRTWCQNCTYLTDPKNTITDNSFTIPINGHGLNAYLNTDITGNNFSGVGTGTLGMQIYTYEQCNLNVTGKNAFTNLETGIAMGNREVNIQGNNFLNNTTGVLFSHGAYSGSQASIRCNTFTAPSVAGTSYGIFAGPLSTMDELGSPALPNGNKFDGTVTQPVTNESAITPLTYYKYGSSTQENLGTMYGSGGGIITPEPGNAATACSGQGAGITGRQSGSSLTYTDILAMMDSLRQNLGTFAELKHFQREIIKYHTQHNQLANLETYLNTLQGLNQEAYNTIGLYLMETNRAQGQEQQAQLIKGALVFYNPTEMEIIYRAKYFDLEGKWHNALPPNLYLGAADSIMLVTIAGSGTTPALKACALLRMFYPQQAACGTSVNAAKQTASSQPSRFATSKAWTATGILGQSYPNPAQAEAIIPYTLPKGCKSAVIVINEVLTGRQVRNYELKATETKLSANLRNLNTGLYTYTLLVDGKPAGTRKLSVVK